MSYLEVGGRRHSVPIGEMVIGSAPTAHIVIEGADVLPRHAVVQGMPEGQAAVRVGGEGAKVLVNGVPLGPQPTPLLHGDKVEVGPVEMLFVDERRSGSTQYVQAIDPAALAARRLHADRPRTAATGGRLVSLTDGREYEVIDTALIGRDAGCDVVLPSRSVSRRHAEVLSSARGYVLVDSSTNGTFVNGERVQGHHLLSRGDVIRCGDYEFRFYADVVDTAPPPESDDSLAAALETEGEPEIEIEPDLEPEPEPELAPPPGAVHRLRHTLHGMPAIRPGDLPQAGDEPRTGRDTPAVGHAPAEPEPPATPPEPSGAGRAAGAGESAARTPAPGEAMANLIVRSGALKGRRFSIRVPVANVGRADYNDVVLPDDSVSTTHAKLQRREGIWVVVDLDSTNGTMVDGERITGEAPLAPGAFVRFGGVQTMFEPTDDTIDPHKGSTTRIMGAIGLPPHPPSQSESNG
jgi:pSer/pThr/pTyr-binding forkhead associated (FHA) protein